MRLERCLRVGLTAVVAAMGVCIAEPRASVGAQGRNPRIADPRTADPRQSLVSVEVRPDTVTVGEPFSVRIRVRAPKVATIRFPDVPAASDGVDPVDPRSIEEGPPGEALDRTALYTFVAWDVGPRAPQFSPVTVVVAGQERNFAIGAPAVVVRSLLPADSSEYVPRAARAPVAVPGRLWQYIVLGVVLLAGAIWWLLRRRARRRGLRVHADPEAWVQAKSAFSALDALALADSGEPGRHVIAHVDVLRAYVARRFPPVPAKLAAADAVAVMEEIDFPVAAHRVGALLERDASLRFAHADVAADEATSLGAEAVDIVAQLQLAHEALLRAVERPPRPRRR